MKARKNSLLTWYICLSRVPRDREEGCGGCFSVNTDSAIQDSNLSLENPRGKAVVAGIKGSDSNLIQTTQLPDNRGNTIKPFITDNTLPDATVYSEDSIVYSRLRRVMDVVNHMVCEYVKGGDHTNGIGSFRGCLRAATTVCSITSARSTCNATQTSSQVSTTSDRLRRLTRLSSWSGFAKVSNCLTRPCLVQMKPGNQHY